MCHFLEKVAEFNLVTRKGLFGPVRTKMKFAIEFLIHAAYTKFESTE
jgi:hypothetical protein